MHEKKSEKKTHQDNDESIVLWILTSLFIVLTTLTVNSYSNLDEQNNKQLTAAPQTTPINTELTLINSKTDSQIDTKTLKM